MIKTRAIFTHTVAIGIGILIGRHIMMRGFTLLTFTVLAVVWAVVIYVYLTQREATNSD